MADYKEDVASNARRRWREDESASQETSRSAAAAMDVLGVSDVPDATEMTDMTTRKAAAAVRRAVYERDAEEEVLMAWRDRRVLGNRIQASTGGCNRVATSLKASLLDR